MITLKIKKNILPIFIIIMGFYFMFQMPYTVARGITEGMKICFYNVLPSLFPFTILSIYLIKTDTLNPLYKLLSPITQFLFHLPPVCVPVIFMSLIGGFPIGSKMSAKLLNNGKITRNQAARINLFCVNGGPAFIITTVGVSMLKSQKAGTIIYISICISSLIIGFFSHFFDDKETINTNLLASHEKPISALTSSISDAVHTMLSICAWIIIFNGFTFCVEELNISKGLFIPIKILSEVTSGCFFAADKFSIPIIAAIIGFGGFCVHCQVIEYISACELKYSIFFTFRAINATLSALICNIILHFFPVEISTIGAVPTQFIPFSVSLPAFISIGFMCIIMIFDIDTKKKLW